MRLEAFICELLYDHDCVVLPDFGGLVANYRAARLNRRTHIIMPPSKHIGFNRNLRTNDGLLANQVAERAGISYKEAVIKVDLAIADYQRQLQKDGRMVLERIGVFFKDKSGQLQFIPEEHENFLLSSYGLGPVQLKYIEQEMETEETPVVPIQDERRRIAGWKIAAAILIPLLFAGSLLVRNQMKEEGKFSLASLNPFHQPVVKADYEPNAFKLDSDKASGATSLSETLENAAGNITYDFTTNSISEKGIEIENAKPKTAEAVSTEVKKEVNPIKEVTTHAQSGSGYAVIGGAFSVAENAENFMKKLQNDGFEASFAGKKDGLQLVAYGVYPSKSEAAKALVKIRNSGGSAWITKSK